MSNVKFNDKAKKLDWVYIQPLWALSQLQYTIQHRTVLIISPLISRQTSWLKCCVVVTSQTLKDRVRLPMLPIFPRPANGTFSTQQKTARLCRHLLI